jgi:hypothetical protein
VQFTAWEMWADGQSGIGTCDLPAGVEDEIASIVLQLDGF